MMLHKLEKLYVKIAFSNKRNLLLLLDKIPFFRQVVEHAERFFLFICLRKDIDLASKAIKDLSKHPLLSILIPVYNTEARTLKQCIASVQAQAYKKWELCIVDDASTLPHVRPVLSTYARSDNRIKLFFSKENKGIAETINQAAEMASGEFIGVLDHDDELTPLTLFEYVKMLNKHPDADLIYCDEDKISKYGVFCDPWFKSDWNPDLSLSFNYVMHFALYRKRLFNRAGGARRAYEGSQDYDLLLRISELTRNIYHIPKILYHWRMGPGSIASGPDAKPLVFVSGLKALNEALRRRGIEGVAEDAPHAWKGVYRVRRRINRNLFISIIVRFNGNMDGLTRLLDSIRGHIPSARREIIICIPSTPTVPEKEMLEKYPGSITRVDAVSLNIPGALNHGAARASGDLLFFLDDTFEIVSPQSVESLVEQIQRTEVGAVGGKVYYANGWVEHSGVIFGPFDLFDYAYRATPDGPGYAGLQNMIGNYSAVMGYGMMTRKKLFMDIGGFDEELARAYWDVDYCLKLREQGYLMTYTPYARFRHHIPVKAINEMIVEPEATLFRSRWQHIIDRDPYFNPNFSRGVEDFSFGTYRSSTG